MNEEAAVSDQSARAEKRQAFEASDSELAALELQSIYANSQMGHALITRDHRYLRINPVLAEINGIPAEDHIGRTIEELLPDFVDQTEKVFEQLEKTGKRIGPLEMHGSTPAVPGVERSWDVFWSPVHDGGGTLVAASISVVETTSLKEVADQLDEAQSTLQVMADTAPVMLALIDKDLTYQLVNVGYAGSFNKKPEDLLGKSVAEVKGAEGFAQIEPLLNRAFAGEVISTSLDLLRGRKTIHVKASLVPRKNKDGEVDAVAVAFTDVSELTSLMRLAEQREAEARETLNSLLSFVGKLLPDGTLIDANETAIAAAGITLDDVLGKPFWECYWWKHSSRVQKQLQAAVNRAATGRAVRYDVDVQVAGGQLVTIDFQLIPVQGEDGSVAYLIPSGVDITERKRFEADLKQSQARLDAALEGANLGVLEFDPVEGLAYFDERLSGWLGTGEAGAAVAIEDFFNLIHPDDQEMVRKDTERLSSSDSDGFVSHEFRVKQADGGWRWVLYSGRFEFEGQDGDRKAVWYTGIMQDITERKQVEDYLRVSRERLDAALRGARLGIVEFYPADERAILDFRAREILGIKQEQGAVSSDQFYQALHPDDRERVARETEEYASPQSDGLVDHEFRVVRPDGTVRWVQSVGRFVSGERGKDGKTVRYSGVFLDVTADKEAEEKLRQSEARLNAALEGAALGTAEFDKKKGTSHWDARASSYIGLPAEPHELPMQEVYERVHPVDREIARAASNSATDPAGDGTFQVEHRINTEDGSERWVSVVGRNQFEGEGDTRRPVGGHAVVTDITERKNEERYRDMLLGELKHRVKNSLATIQAIASQTTRSAKSLEEFEQVFRARLQAIASAHDIITDKVGAGVDIRDMIKAQVGAYASEDTGNLELSGKDLSLGGTSAHTLGLVLHELATNASKYGSLSVEKGSIYICWDRLEGDDEGYFRLEWHERDGPRVSQPESKGFGSRLVDISVNRFERGRYKMDFNPDGLLVEIIMPIEADY